LSLIGNRAVKYGSTSQTSIHRPHKPIKPQRYQCKISLKPWGFRVIIIHMGRRAKPTPEKYCQLCEKKLERKRLPNGDLEALFHFNRRKYCNQICFAKASEGQKKETVGWMTAHYHARKKCPHGPCVKCQTPNALDVHHKDGNWRNNSLDNLERICRSCHNKEHGVRSIFTICGSPAKGLGYCEKHYQRFKKYGDPNLVKVNQHSPVPVYAD